jgi:hypothetical protein
MPSDVSRDSVDGVYGRGKDSREGTRIPNAIGGGKFGSTNVFSICVRKTHQRRNPAERVAESCAPGRLDEAIAQLIQTISGNPGDRLSTSPGAMETRESTGSEQRGHSKGRSGLSRGN